MIYLDYCKKSLIILLALSLVIRCSQHVSAEQTSHTELPLSEASTLGELPTLPPKLLDTIIAGDSEAAAKALLEVTYDERSALASVSLLLPRLDECGEKMDDAILVCGDGQPIWMRLYSSSYAYSHGMPGRKHQILLRLADCIREASPSQERARARTMLFAALAPDFLKEISTMTRIAKRAVIFEYPVGSLIKSEAGWDELFNLFDLFVHSNSLAENLNDPVIGAMTENQLSYIIANYFLYCRLYPEKQSKIFERNRDVQVFVDELSKSLERFHELSERGIAAARPCSESYYRTLLRKSAAEWVEIYTGKDHAGATRVLEGLLTGTRQARVESFPLVKPYLETYQESRKSYYRWVSLLQEYCVPVADNAANEEIERQQWLMDELVSQIERGERGDQKSGADPVRLLRLMILPLAEQDSKTGHKSVVNPYGKERVLDVLLAQTVSTNTSAAESALRELEVLCKFDNNTARSIEQGLSARKESILTEQYPSDDLSAPSREAIYKAMELTIKRAQSEIK